LLTINLHFHNFDYLIIPTLCLMENGKGEVRKGGGVVREGGGGEYCKQGMHSNIEY